MPVTRRDRTSLVVVAGDKRTNDEGARTLARSLGEAGIEVFYLGRERNARRIARLAAAERAGAVEVCVADGGAAGLLRELLKELKELNRADIRIVVHRVE